MAFRSLSNYSNVSIIYSVPRYNTSIVSNNRLSKDISRRNDYNLSGDAIRIDFYMNDFLGGASTRVDALKLRNDLRNILGKGGLYLQKRTTIDPDLLNDLNTTK